MIQRIRKLIGMDKRSGGGDDRGVDLLSDDLLHDILSRLPALSFASAACVSRSWRRIAGAVLSRPKLAAAISLNHSFQVFYIIDKCMVLFFFFLVVHHIVVCFSGNFGKICLDLWILPFFFVHDVGCYRGGSAFGSP